MIKSKTYVIINFKINICKRKKLSIVAIFCFHWKLRLSPILLEIALIFPWGPSPWFQPSSFGDGSLSFLPSFSWPGGGHMTYTCPVMALHLLASLVKGVDKWPKIGLALCGWSCKDCTSELQVAIFPGKDKAWENRADKQWAARVRCACTLQTWRKRDKETEQERQRQWLRHLNPSLQSPKSVKLSRLLHFFTESKNWPGIHSTDSYFHKIVWVGLMSSVTRILLVYFPMRLGKRHQINWNILFWLLIGSEAFADMSIPLETCKWFMFAAVIIR